jgi:hypothetical protein
MVDLLSFSAAGPSANYEVCFVFSYSNYHAIDCIKFVQLIQGQSN